MGKNKRENLPELENVLKDIMSSGDPRLNKLLLNVLSEVKSFSEGLLVEIEKLVEIGRALSAERNLDRLLQKILDEARIFTNADAGTLYIKEGNCLKFEIIENISMNIRMGGTSGNPITFPPVELKESNVSAYAAIKEQSISIPDVYHSDLFDFTGPKKFDEATKYRTKSMLVVPMKNHEDDIIGVVQLINAQDQKTGEVIPFSSGAENIINSLASQAAVAITNARLINDMEELFSSFVRVMASAIDEKSPVTGGHIKRVADLTMVMAEVINNQSEGTYARIHFSEDQLYELKMAAWMHDIGKVTTPVEIVEKGKKLEKLFDRVHYVGLKFLHHAQSVELEGLRRVNELVKNGASPAEIEKTENETKRLVAEIMEAREFAMSCNEPGEFMSEDKIARLNEIAKMTYWENGKELPLLNEDELHNLSIRKGSITEEERKKMQHHAAVSIKMLEQIPFTKKLKNIPRFAGAHHEYLNGKGYPNGLKGDEIPLEGRLLAVMDIVEALTAADRPYKTAMPLEQAYKILGFMVKDGELDGEIVDLLIKEKVYERYIEECQKSKEENEEK